MIGTRVDWVLVVVSSTMPEGASRYTLPPFRTPEFKNGYPSEADALKRVVQVERICFKRWGAAPKFQLVRRERKIREPRR